MSKKLKTAGIVATILLHILVLLILLYQPPKQPKTVPEADSVTSKPLEVKLIPFIEPVVSQEPIKPQPDGDKVIHQTDKIICADADKKYKGIGIIFSPLTGTVLHAPEFYPGYKAGLREGDIILDPSAAEINGYVDFDVVRDNEQFHVHIKTELICYQED